MPTGSMDQRLLVQALADGELDAASALALEQRMAGDAALAAEQARIVALKSAVARLPRPEVSDQFKARIAGLVPPPAAAPAIQASPRRLALHDWRGDWRALAASIAVTAVVASGSTYLATRTATAPDRLISELASSQQRSLLAASPVDVASSDRHTVKPWLDAKVGLSPPTVDLSKDGYSLVGGRIEVIGGRPLPALVYRLRKHLITVIAAPQGTGAALPAGAADLSADGFSLVRWSDGTFTYWAISNIGRAELDDFAAHFRAAAAAE